MLFSFLCGWVVRTAHRALSVHRLHGTPIGFALQQKYSVRADAGFGAARARGACGAGCVRGATWRARRRGELRGVRTVGARRRRYARGATRRCYAPCVGATRRCAGPTKHSPGARDQAGGGLRHAARVPVLWHVRRLLAGRPQPYVALRAAVPGAARLQSPHSRQGCPLACYNS